MRESTEHDGTREKCDSAGFDESLWRAGAREEGNLPGQRVTQKQDSPERQDSRQTKCLPAILGTLLLLVISCTSPVTLLTPTVSYAPVNDGANLHLTWLAVTNATAYNVSLLTRPPQSVIRPQGPRVDERMLVKPKE